MKAGDVYTCAICGGSFVTDWSEEEALAETEQRFGYVPPADERALVCETCDKEFEAWARKHARISG